ncbi:DUF5684 domain-containing protein [Pseudarthrobacter sp. N5]|uniref:DUF5684 domain-containing protein n=1 Tax=Pseudarthrobacter sp. N5 TaxID=3418416 RepID=UPI003CF81043
MHIPLSYGPTSSAAALNGLFLLLVIEVIVIFGVSGLLYMGIFRKAGQPAWAAFIPVYNNLKILEIAGRPWYWLLLMLIPFAGIYFAIVALHDLSKSFGKGAGYTVGLVLLPIVFVPMLSYGASRYFGPAALQQFAAYPQPYGYPQYPQEQYPPQPYNRNPDQNGPRS